MSRQHQYFFVLLIPVFVHFLLFFVSIPSEYRLFKIDNIILYAVAIYILSSGVFSYIFTKHAVKFVVVTYATIISFVVAECIVMMLFANSSFVNYHSIVLHNSHLSLQEKVANKIDGVDEYVKFTTNSIQLRSEEISNFADVDVAILCIGGSTTECLPVTDAKIWTAVLQKRLDAKLDKKVYVGNAGKAGMFTVSHKQVLEKYVHLQHFDWVVILCGINDLATFLRNDYEYRSYKQQNDSAVYYKRFYSLNLIQTLYRQRYASQDIGGRYIEINREKRRRSPQVFNEIQGNYSLALERYRKDLLDIVEICDRKNKKLVLMTQPTLWHENMSPQLQTLLWQNTSKGCYPPKILAKMMADYNNIMLDICREKNILCVDLAKRLPKDTSVFIDDCHFNNSGCEKIGAILVDFFLSQIQNK